jgi:hypothetical protein
MPMTAPWSSATHNKAPEGFPAKKRRSVRSSPASNASGSRSVCEDSKARRRGTSASTAASSRDVAGRMVNEGRIDMVRTSASTRD